MSQSSTQLVLVLRSTRINQNWRSEAENYENPPSSDGLRTDKRTNIEITVKREDGAIGYDRDSSVGTATRYGLEGPGIEL